MIVCKDFGNWGGRFGNRIFYLNNTIQISEHFGHKFYCKKFNGSEIFEISDKLIENNFDKPNIDIELPIDNLVKKPKEEWDLNPDKNYEIDYCIHEFFFEFDKLSTFEIFKYKKEYLEKFFFKFKEFDNQKHIKVGIHFRGTDFSSWDPKSILSSSYYISSIDYIISNFDGPFKFFIHSDDYSLISFIETTKYLKSKNLNFKICNDNSWYEDLISMAHSDVLISSPSTFCIVSGFTGKKDKKIIHSKEWVDNYRVKTNYFRDIFWKVLLEKGGNENYCLHKTI